MKKSLGWVFCGIVLSLMVFAEARAAKGDIGSAAPEWSLPGLDGKKVKLSDFKGKVVILDFWATWCPPCREEIPSFIQIQKDYADKGVVVVGIALDEEGESAVKPFAKKQGINYPIVMDKTSKTGDLYGGVEGIPTTFIIGADGKIVAKHVGLTSKEEFIKELSPLLKTPSK
jgi:thiol-disulfide isomerase/thioredoxin